MWAAVSASVAGTSHRKAGIPCQDSCGFLCRSSGANQILVAILADGAGSASRSEVGSAESVDYGLNLLAAADLDFSSFDDESIRRWYQEIRSRLDTVAAREGVAFNDLACTLLMTVIWREGAVFAQIGDGVWVYQQNGCICNATWPETGEFANVTTFITSEHALDRTTDGTFRHLQIKRVQGSIEAIAGLTDGLQDLSLDYSNRSPFQPFFRALLKPLWEHHDPISLAGMLKAGLDSDLINSRTDDDKSLVLAARNTN
ncbi:MAG: protein phosphatase 2C domain-containing protein [Verrucomicrobiales bacterium]|nr:protein phosphatase 2C domain-containing protein [Verrucomicrobiales bacterium]